MIDSLLLDTLLVLGSLALIIAFVVYQVYQFRSLASHGRQISAMVTSIRHETGKTA
jgi:heme/copper-type cytochrome/quinol oxidase subunit 3